MSGKLDSVGYTKDVEMSKGKPVICRVGRHFHIIARALLVRLIFVVHGMTSVWRVVETMGSDWWWFMASTLIFLPIEMIITLKKSKGGEFTWFCPCFLIFLLTVIPTVWIMEFDRLDLRLGMIGNVNTTVDPAMEPYEPLLNNSYLNLTESGNLTGSNQEVDRVKTVIPLLNLEIDIDQDTWVWVLEQSMLFLLIICRWILPRGKVTEDQLSQLMFVFIGMSSDIMDLFTLFDARVVTDDRIVFCAILAVWSLSLFQFTFVLTATKAPKTQVAHSMGMSDELREEQRPICACLETEIWSLLMSILMQDLPFLVLRLYIIIQLKVFTYSLLFFTVKNSLVAFFQFYRIIVVLCNN